MLRLTKDTADYMTQAELADELGVHASTVYKLKAKGRFDHLLHPDGSISRSKAIEWAKAQRKKAKR